jgi:dihydroorotase
MDLLIRGGRVVDPGQLDGLADIYVRDGKIAGIQRGGSNEAPPAGCRVIEARDRWVVPGLVDLHVHFREPGHEYKETIATGSRSAAAGGFTSVCTMPNTDPVNDCAQVTAFILGQAKAAGLVRVHPAAAVSPGSLGKGLTEFGELAAAGAVAFTDDGRPVVNSLLMRRALEYASAFDRPIIAHCEDPDLSAGGAMNEGPVATRLGLSGIPNAAEAVMVERDLALCALTGGRLHVAHVSTREAVRAIRQAKARGVRVTAETAPHYFSLTDEAVGNYDTNAKMYPPLRSQADREAVIEGLADGTLDAIASDHAPHSSIEKEVEFDQAANGIIGLETSLGLGLKLVAEGSLSLERLIDAMAIQPARILGLPAGLRTGQPADITIIDPGMPYTVDRAKLCSRSRNTPFSGWELKGRAVATVLGGRISYALEA